MVSNRKVVRVDVGGLHGSGLEPCQLIDPADVVGEDMPSETLGVFDSPKGVDMQIGIWTCSPCVEKVDRFAVNEFCVVGAGRIRLTDDEGHTEVFSRGEAFIMYKGFSGLYEVEEDLVKYYASFEVRD